jgi:hypothetical protein
VTSDDETEICEEGRVLCYGHEDYGHDDHRHDFKRGDRVRMTFEHKRKLCANDSGAHVDEFGDCIGLVEDLVDYGHTRGPELNVRWLPSGLRYGYHPHQLTRARDKA